ncbi:MAG: hypothetical protein WBW33_00565 [Bryobacteraceae bacterium]
MRELVRWLIHQHHAKVIKQAGIGSGNAPEGTRLTADCIECAGAGRDSAGGRCSHCNGLGIIWVLLAEKLHRANALRGTRDTLTYEFGPGRLTG